LARGCWLRGNSARTGCKTEAQTVKAFFVNLVWKLVLLGAVLLCTAIGWMLYDIARYGRFDSIVSEWFHTVQVYF
jgi:hypothetical protein